MKGWWKKRSEGIPFSESMCSSTSSSHKGRAVGYYLDVLIDAPLYFVLPQSPSSIYATARLFYLSYSQRRGWAAELENKRIIFLALEFPKPRFKYKIKTQHKTKLRKAQSVTYSVSLSLRLDQIVTWLEDGSEETQTWFWVDTWGETSHYVPLPWVLGWR